jgi:hypothetical protein
MERNLEETLVPIEKDFFHYEAIKVNTRIKNNEKEEKRRQ